MTDEREIESIFAAAVKLATADIDAFLDEKCAGNPELRQKVQSLLEANAVMGSFLERTRAHSAEVRQELPSPEKMHKSTVHGQFLPGTMIQQRYRIVSLIGRGGMGEVYRADDLKLGQTVALKFLPNEFSANQKWLDFFHNEVSLTRRISHPSVCRVYDVGEFGNQHFLSMEYIDGEDLRSLLRRIGRLPPDKGLEIAQQLCRGLAAAHESGVLHRDLKPANIMIDGQGRAKITDFGLATISSEAVTGELAGTPAYMAPEQLLRGQTSEQSDLYSLGLVLSELLMGKPVNKAESLQSLRESHQSSDVDLTSHLSKVDVDPIVESAILKCLQKKPEDRPVSARQLANALPGGDPLDAAIAAGTTPLPEMILNSQDQNPLNLKWAVVLLALVVCAVIGTAIINNRVVQYYEAAPAIHAARCEGMMSELGYAELPQDSIFNVSSHATMSQDLARGTRSTDWFQKHRQPPYQFWKKWTNGSYAVEDTHFPMQFSFDRGAVNSTFDARVMLDEKGKLLRLQVEGSRIKSEDSQPAFTEWNQVLELAGIAPESVQTIVPVVAPPVHCDQVIAWSAEDGSELIVQAGALGGKVNYYETVGLPTALKHPKPPKVAYVSTIVLSQIFIWTFAIVNLLCERCDWRGALRAGLFVLVIYGLIEIMSIRFSSNTLVYDGIGLIYDRAWGHAVGHAFSMVGTYLAIEPFVRRYWPRKLVGLARALQGRMKDPQVGREVLQGVAAGTGVTLLTGLLTPALYDGSLSLTIHSEFTQEHIGAYWLAHNLQAFSTAFLLVFMISALVVIVRTVVGNRGFWFVIVAATIFLGFTIGQQFTWYFSVAIVVAIGCLVVFTLTRIGFLAALILMAILLAMLPTFAPADPNRWYGIYGFLGMVIPLGTALYGFTISQGGFGGILDRLVVRSQAD